jgi:ABC-type uncharacterized transport system substrate-binding protein
LPSTDGQYDRVSGLLTDLTQRKVRSVPIVAAVMNDPLTLGYIDSLAKPGGNMTGFQARKVSKMVNSCVAFISEMGHQPRIRGNLKGRVQIIAT